MVTKRTGISADLIIHPGETVADVLKKRGITQAELAARTGTSTEYAMSSQARKMFQQNLLRRWSMPWVYPDHSGFICRRIMTLKCRKETRDVLTILIEMIPFRYVMFSEQRQL